MVQMCYVYSKESSRKMVISARNFCEIKKVHYKCCYNGKIVLSESFNNILLPYCQQKLIKNCINTCD